MYESHAFSVRDAYRYVHMLLVLASPGAGRVEKANLLLQGEAETRRGEVMGFSLNVDLWKWCDVNDFGEKRNTHI